MTKQKPSLELTVERMRSGEYIARPINGLGNVGWAPFPWTACYAKTASRARALFNKNHGHHIRRMKGVTL